MKSAKGMLLIDALFALLVVMVLVVLTGSFAVTYYRYKMILEKNVEYNEEEPGLYLD